ncbi:MAG: type II secretion system protein [Chloroflexi bacterium]|nr:type II secretion system protein [Chloroflexota bacterium]
MYGRGQKNSFLRRREGFTLIELIVVIAIIGILVAIVVPSVAGTKTLSVAAQVDGDGRETQTGVDSYHNRSTIRDQWPEQPFGTTYPDPAGGSRKFLDENDTEITGFGNSHTELDFSATTTVSDTSGGEKTVTFVPAFLLKAPSSFILDNDDGLVDTEGDPLPEFLWVLKVTSEGSEAEGRLVEVYRLSSVETVEDNTVAIYQQVF